MAGPRSLRWEALDRYGNRIYFTSERWRHATEQRPWLAEYPEQVLQTLRRGRRKQDPLDPQKYKYYWPCEALFPEYSHLVVLVRFGATEGPPGRSIPNNFVLTVWGVFIYGKR
jgi:hypothetical protein